MKQKFDRYNSKRIKDLRNTYEESSALLNCVKSAKSPFADSKTKQL